MIVKELIEKLTDPKYYDKYKDCEVEKAAKTESSETDFWVGDKITRVILTDNVTPDGTVLPIELRKVILL